MEEKNKQIPAGYKDSPLGVIPAEWEVKRLGEVCSHFKSGASITAKNITETGDYPVYGGNGLRGYTNNFTHEGAYVLIGRQGALCGNINYIEGKNYISEHAIAVQVFGCIHWLKYKLDYWNLNKYSESSAQPGLSVEKLLRYKLTLPPLPEQQRIAEVLGTWDQGIELQAKLLESLQKRKRALMQQLLTGKKRLKGFDQAWKKVRIRELGNVITGNTPSMQNAEFYGDTYCWATAIDFKNKYINDTSIKLSEIGKMKARIVPENSVLVTCIASIGKNAIAKVETGFNQQINAIIPNKGFDSEFIFYQIENSIELLKEVAGSGAVQIINKSNFENIKLSIPVFPEQQAIAEILTAADREIELAQKKLEVLREQKRGLMQQLLTGKKRLKV